MSAKRNLLIGIGVGAVLGVLFAPHKGIKTRRKLAERGAELAEGWSNLKANLTNAFSNIENESEEYLSDASNTPAYINSSMQDEWKGSSMSEEWKSSSTPEEWKG